MKSPSGHSSSFPTPENGVKETVLLSLMGLTPAILTETLWAIAGHPRLSLPGKVVVVTTGPGRDLLVERLFAENRWDPFLKALARHTGLEPDQMPRFGPVSDCLRVIPERSLARDLLDIRSEQDNEVLADFLMQTVRSFTENPDVELLVSLAGGRKTMSALLHAVMTLLGRAEDTLLHVLVEPPWEGQRDFFYPGCPGVFLHPDTGARLDSRDAVLHLAEVPFVPLRYLFERDLKQAAGGFIPLMQRLRARSFTLGGEMEITLRGETGSLVVQEKELQPTPLGFVLLLFFARRLHDQARELQQLKEIDPDSLLELARLHLREDDFGHWAHRVQELRIDPSEDYRKALSKLRHQMREALVESFWIQRIVPSRGCLCIQLPPDNVHIEP